MAVSVFLPDFVRAFATGASDLGVWNSLATPATPIFLPDLGVFFPDFPPDLGVVEAFLFDAGVFLADTGVLLVDAGVFLVEGVLLLDKGVLTLGVGVFFLVLLGDGCGVLSPLDWGIASSSTFGVFIILRIDTGLGETADGLALFGVCTRKVTGLGEAAGTLVGMGVFTKRRILTGLGLAIILTALGVFINLATPVGLAGEGATLGVFINLATPVGLAGAGAALGVFINLATPVGLAGEGATLGTGTSTRLLLGAGEALEDERRLLTPFGLCCTVLAEEFTGLGVFLDDLGVFLADLGVALDD